MNKEEIKCCNCNFSITPIAPWITFGGELLGQISYCNQCGVLFFESYNSNLQNSYWKIPINKEN
jgi:hypothetical protein